MRSKALMVPHKRTDCMWRPNQSNESNPFLITRVLHPLDPDLGKALLHCGRFRSDSPNWQL
jgi:hypothetical protein